MNRLIVQRLRAQLLDTCKAAADDNDITRDEVLQALMETLCTIVVGTTSSAAEASGIIEAITQAMQIGIAAPQRDDDKYIEPTQ
jgi:hypothetical protein